MGEDNEGTPTPPQRQRPAQSTGGGDDAGTGQSGQGDRQEADDFLQEAENAIDRALSGDSEKFIEDNRQQGGE